MNLPTRFQFRNASYPGFTHSMSLNTNGDYEAKWARGYCEALGTIPFIVFDSNVVADLVSQGLWTIVVEDKPKQATFESELPDEFYFNYTKDIASPRFKAAWDGEVYQITWAGQVHASTYDKKHVQKILEIGDWKILDKKPLTAEQQLRVKEYKEQITQLDQSIKLNQQDIAHKERLVANYVSRQDDLRKKIEEMEGK